ncbi:MAG: class I SAM-dependent methyltransferase [Chloroflexi bacterium]|nr:class I SAM-dependent methyltransferase [Chloroflexota bacterium]MCL5109738.1 class I SAM-dependent methyltransferase [Chloroflexota bacterium]
MTGASARESLGHDEPDAFDRQAARYDAWYDAPLGSVAFREEQDALRPLLAGLSYPRLEVGVGSGRFAAALDVAVGIDPAPAALALAARRGIRVAVAQGERLPFPEATFGGVLFLTALCFVGNPLAALLEARRVLRPEGRIVLGLLPSEGPWGQHYRALAAAGNAYYQRAHFFTRAELASLFAAAGLRPVRARSALFWPPAGGPVGGTAREGDDLAAGFSALLLGVARTTPV